MKIVAIVPIKLNNERLPGKNTKLLGEKPLVRYILDTLLQIKRIDEVYVYCSSDDICNCLPKNVRYLKRSRELDLPNSNFTQIFTQFKKSIPSDIYVYAHATAPFVSVSTIDKEIDAVLSNDFDSAFCAERIQDFLWKEGKPLNFDANNLPRSQDLPVYYRETSGVYVFTAKTFEQYNARVGIKPYISEVSLKEAIDINTLEEFCLAEILLDKEIIKEAL